ncbi:hypothetical protein BDR05DRAFT_1002414 [Suillus weaverae]|nr:hypothetical protein BDR05DRAFT_1002414 [Suillus weaverae]
MSNIPPNTPFMKLDYTPFCEHGHGELQWRIMKSDKNGSRGCWMVSCPFIVPEGKCKYFQWGSKSPTSSPNPSLSPLPQSGPPPLLWPPMLTPPAVPVVCAEAECTSTCVHPQCGHLMCRKHCWVSGSCDAKGHNIVGPAGEVLCLHPPPEVTSCAAPPPPVIDPVLLVLGSSSQTPTASPPTAGPSTLPPASQMRKGKGCATVPAHNADFYSNPHLPSQLPPIFTDAYAKQEAERLQKYEAQSLECELALTAQNTDGDIPAVCKFQSRIVLPHVRVMVEWLHNLGLSIDNDCHYFNAMQQCWNRIFIGHVLTLPGNHVYFKNLDVKVAHDFDKYYTNRQPPTVPHIYNNLKGKRAYVCNTTCHFQVSEASTTSNDSDQKLPPVSQKWRPHFSSNCSHCRHCIYTGSSQADMHALLAPYSLLHTTIKDEQYDVISTSSNNSTDDKTPPKPLHIKREPSVDGISISLDFSSVVSDNDMPSPGMTYKHPIKVETTVVLPPWPQWYYAVDINMGFTVMENARKSGCSVKEAFTSVFGDVPYCLQTVSNHHICWNQAGPTARAAFIKVGCTPTGLWSVFMAAYPTKGATEKAAKKCLAHVS